MAIGVTIPRLGWNMDEGVFAGWLKKDGDTVRPGEPLFRLEGEKAVEEIESLDGGILHIAPDGPKEGDHVLVGALIGYLVASGEPSPFTTPSAASPAQTVAEPASIPAAAKPGAAPAAVHRGAVTEPRRRRAASPRARRVARELGIDWQALEGSGHGGRVRERDVRAASATTVAAPAITPVRRAIAEHMLQSVRTTAPVTLATTVDADNLVNLRSQFRTVAKEAVPAYTDILIKLAALTLRDYPALNSHWDGDRIVPPSGIHIALAVDTEAGLLAPVLRDADRLGLREITALSRDLITRARARQLKADEMHGGTFTISNLGNYGVEVFTPIIPVRQCAILGIGRIRREAVVRDERIVPGTRLTLNLTFDHRIVDGAPAARFLQALAQRVENPGPALMP
jgi:pyruvate dehydrogenase E2 component (dihydrolipoamide acetyltransferase)